jgi:hypothetical protein
VAMASRPRWYLQASLLVLMVNLAANVVVLPKFGAAGAATTTIAAQGLLVVLLRLPRRAAAS